MLFPDLQFVLLVALLMSVIFAWRLVKPATRVSRPLRFRPKNLKHAQVEEQTKMILGGLFWFPIIALFTAFVANYI
jgi:hypothetical protein